MKRVLFAALVWLSLCGVGHAQFGLGLENVPMPSFSIIESVKSATGVDLAAVLSGACQFSGAQYLCQLKDIVSMIDNLGAYGLDSLKRMGIGLAEGWVRDFVSNIGDICIKPGGINGKNTLTDALAFPEFGGQQGQCLNDLTGEVYGWLKKTPDDIFKSLEKLGQSLYVSQLRKTFGPYSATNPEPKQFSATWWQERALKMNPLLGQEYMSKLAAQTETSIAIGKSTIALNESIKSLEPGAKDQAYLDQVQAVTQYDCNPATDPVPDLAAKAAALAGKVVIDPCTDGGGIAVRARNSAKTAVSSREVLQTMVDLQADAITNDVFSTTEISGRLKQLSGLQIQTNNQLQLLVRGIYDEKLQKSNQMKAALETQINDSYNSGLGTKAFVDTAQNIVITLANPDIADGMLNF